MYNPKKIKVKNNRDLNNLHPLVAKLAEDFLKLSNKHVSNLGYEIRVISTLRDWEEQQRIYNQGRTTPGPIVSNAKPGNSIHNWGCAFDVGVFKAGKYLDNINPSEAIKIHKKIAPLGKKLGLFWGGDFTRPIDYPHYQFTGKYSNSEFLSLAKSGKPIDYILDPILELIHNIESKK